MTEAHKNQLHFGDNLAVLREHVKDNSVDLQRMSWTKAIRIQEITDALHKMENEFHELNVQQIREELKGG